MGDHVLDAKEHALDVDPLDVVPLSLGELVGRLVGAGDASVVDQDIDPAEPPGDFTQYALDVGFARDVELPETGVGAARGEFVDEGVCLPDQDVANRDRAAFLGHAQGGGPPEAERATGDHRDLPLQSVHAGLLC